MLAVVRRDAVAGRMSFRVGNVPRHICAVDGPKARSSALPQTGTNLFTIGASAACHE